MKKLLIILFLLSTTLISGCNDIIIFDGIFKNFLANENEEGNVYSVEEHFSTVNNNDNVSIMIKTDGRAIHLLEYAITIGDNPDDVFLFENPTITNNGTVADVIIRNRESPNNSTAFVYRDPTITDFGTKLDRDLLISGKDQGGQIRRVPYNWILKSNSTYLIVANNRGGGVTEAMFNIIWYEVDK